MSLNNDDLTQALVDSFKYAETVKLDFLGHGQARLIEELKTPFGNVPRKFLTDGFSIPWYARWFHNPFGKGLIAAIWHDFALKAGRKNPHKEFFMLLRARKVQVWKAYPMWFFVWIYDCWKKIKPW
ncbi:DUF1353 domain-containing protein [Pseudoalteromonas ruthenica]|uniref:DUF1353 domain-containing protein n=1 Tax=Pseudoalteromonas ruthenica TaxID=151081 RepID=UPI0014864C69|nr:DUF1353 domain-containing protein [Pseudoalteromonas ruthenica]